MRIIAALCCLLAIVGCQSKTTAEREPAAMGIEEARQVSADFKHVDFVPPPRSANDLNRVFGDLKPIPNDCASQISECPSGDFMSRMNRLSGAPS